MDATAHDRERERIEAAACAEASLWIVRLHGPNRNRQLEAGFREWLAADPENGRQFELVTQTWDAGGTAWPETPRIAYGEDAAPKRRWLLAAVIALVVLSMGGWGANRFWLNPSYTTQIGEQRIVRLVDGSRVTLNSDSRVVVSYRKAERRLSVERGEAFFEVANEVARPFRVTAGDHVVEALGTSFVVRREAQQLTVTLVEGRVAIRPLTESLVAESDVKTEPPVTLKPGQRLRVALSDINVPDSVIPHIDAPPIDAATAWRRGELMLDKTALSDAVAEMNRYDHRQLIIDDARSAAIQVSGIYHTGDSEVFARMVAGMYGLELSERDGNIHLRSGAVQGM